MPIAKKIMSYLEYEGPNRVVNARQFGHLSSNSKTINKAFERLEREDKVERVARGYYRLNRLGNPIKIALSFKRASGIPLAPFGALCYEDLGLRPPRHAPKNTFVSHSSLRQNLTMNGKKYRVLAAAGYYDYGVYLGKASSALNILEQETSNLAKAMPKVLNCLNFEDADKLLYHIPRLGSTRLKVSDTVRSIINLNRGHREARRQVNV